MSNQQLHTRTPTVVVHDNRGSAIREISYCRHPDMVNQTDERITRHHYHARGYLERSIDARLYDSQQLDASIQPNIQQTVSLGKALSLSQGVDNGNSFNFNDIEGTVAQQINAKGTVTIYKYSQSGFERYLEKVEEGKLGNSDTKVIQKFKWGQGNASQLIETNQVGKCIEHFDTAGKKTYSHYSLQGAVISETQQFIVGNNINWSTGSEQSIQQAEKFTTQYTYDATGAVLEETDAKGNKRRIAYDIAGFVKQTWLTLKGQSEQAILRALTYSAAGQKLREEQGNGLVTTYEYEPETQRLLHIKTERPQGHALGAKVMQDLRYEYDAVGNIICLKNDAEATRYWRNQKVVPENRYIYDSLYQLVSATGRESANQKTPASIQSQTITTLVKDVQSYTNYTRLYTYDRGGNLTQIRHHSAIAQQSFTQDIIVSNKTNRALLKSQCSDPKNVDSYFDESGNLTQLLNGDAIIWDSRNHLKATKEIMENGQLSEGETYQYNSASQRMTKIRGRKTANGDLEKVTTHYLPNIEQWEVSTRSVTEKYVVVQIQTGTSAKVRALCWEIGSPKGIENNSLRYSYDDGIGNSGLETDGKGQLVSYEEYYPYGGTAIWSSENVVEADYKTIRYSGKEKDSTGMYYYGYRYYQPWIGRWLSADPAGTIDGLNLYRMVKGNPTSYIDDNGLMFKKLSASIANRREHNSSNDISTASSAIGASGSGKQSQLNISNSKNDLIGNIIERLVDIVETGRGGMRTLQGDQFNETMTKLASLYIDLQPEGALSGGHEIMKKSKGFKQPPKGKGLVNQNKERGNLYDFMTPYVTRDVDSENFCLQNVTSDLHKWTEHVIDKQQKRLPTGKAVELLMRMNKAADPEVTRAEFTKNPTSRPPEDQEEAIQYVYYMAGIFESESEWKELARDMYTDEYPQLKKVTYKRAKAIFDKNKSLSVYKVD
ncbi:RHS repeat domain-containing protein [Proteus faecis]|uniref:RHS repeat domain-containing protein n=1 Tax=Proteus faecis TaxID=2050967 RepID=UPI0013A57128|nr:RHS repeat protein [Proteus faecis]